MSDHDSGYDPPEPDDDAITYLPIDKAKESRIPFGPTDLRGASPTGGIRIGQTFIFVTDAAMPKLDATHIGHACDNIIRGQNVYASLVYLGRARLDDLPSLAEASQSFEIKVRWERLWILSPFLARLARQPEGPARLVEVLREDLAGVHLLSKFAEQKNPAVKKLFGRIHDPMLVMLLERLHEYHRDGRRAALLCSIIASFETSEDVLRQALTSLKQKVPVDELLQMLATQSAGQKETKLSSQTLKDKLETWRQR